MKIKKAIKILRQHNKYRRDDCVPNSQTMQNPALIGLAIDAICDYEGVINSWKKEEKIWLKLNNELEVKNKIQKDTIKRFRKNADLAGKHQNEYIEEIRYLKDTVDRLEMWNKVNSSKVINRVEVIDQKGRSYVNHKSNNTANVDLQDDGKTLKVFIFDK